VESPVFNRRLTLASLRNDIHTEPSVSAPLKDGGPRGAQRHGDDDARCNRSRTSSVLLGGRGEVRPAPPTPRGNNFVKITRPESSPRSPSSVLVIPSSSLSPALSLRQNRSAATEVLEWNARGSIPRFPRGWV